MPKLVEVFCRSLSFESFLLHLSLNPELPCRKYRLSCRDAVRLLHAVQVLAKYKHRTVESEEMQHLVTAMFTAIRTFYNPNLGLNAYVCAAEKVGFQTPFFFGARTISLPSSPSFLLLLKSSRPSSFAICHLLSPPAFDNVGSAANPNPKGQTFRV